MRPHTLYEARCSFLLVVKDRIQRFWPASLNFTVRPPWYLYNKIDDLFVAWVRVEGDVVPEGDWLVTVQEIHPPILYM